MSAVHDGIYCRVSGHRLYTTFSDALWDTRWVLYSEYWCSLSIRTPLQKWRIPYIVHPILNFGLSPRLPYWWIAVSTAKHCTDRRFNQSLPHLGRGWRHSLNSLLHTLCFNHQNQMIHDHSIWITWHQSSPNARPVPHLGSWTPSSPTPWASWRGPARSVGCCRPCWCSARERCTPCPHPGPTVHRSAWWCSPPGWTSACGHPSSAGEQKRASGQKCNGSIDWGATSGKHCCWNKRPSKAKKIKVDLTPRSVSRMACQSADLWRKVFCGVKLTQSNKICEYNHRSSCAMVPRGNSFNSKEHFHACPINCMATVGKSLYFPSPQ